MVKLKSIVFFAGLALLAAGCSNESEETVINNQAPVCVHVDGFKVSQESLSRVTRAVQNVADYDGVNALTLAFYDGSTEVEKITQVKTSMPEGKTFGQFECSLPMGSYTMVVVAYKTMDGSPFTLTSPTAAAFTGDHAFESFVYTQSVTISNNNPVDIGATLERIVSKLKVVSTDGKTANVTNVRMTFSAGGKDFNPTTGWAITNTGFSNTVGNSYDEGAKSGSLSYLFLNADEQTMDVTIETLDAEGNTLFSETVKDVSFKRNYVTKLTGAMYSNSSISGGFKVETEWITFEEKNF